MAYLHPRGGVEMLKELRIGSILMTIMGVFALVVSMLWVLITDIMFVSDFEVFTGITYASYLASDPVYAEFYLITKKLVGMILIVVALQILFIAKYGFEKGERWAWYAELVSGGLLWGTLLGYRAYIGYLGGSTITFVLGLVLYLLAIIIPVKVFLGKKTA